MLEASNGPLLGAEFMASGYCHQGVQCKFAHGKQDLRPGSSARLRRNKNETWTCGYEQAALKPPRFV